MTPSRLRPEIVATLELAPGAVPPLGVAGPTMGGPTPAPEPPEPTEEQLAALSAVVDELDDGIAQRLLGTATEITIRVKRADPGERWIRAK